MKITIELPNGMTTKDLKEKDYKYLHRKFRIHFNTVAFLRKCLGIYKRGGPALPLPFIPDEELKKMTSRKLYKKYKIGMSKVALLRKERGIDASKKGGPRKKPCLATNTELRYMTASELGRKYRVCNGTVTKWRKKRNITRCNHYREVKIRKPRAEMKKNFYLYKSLFETMRDSHIARLLGYSREYIRQVREWAIENKLLEKNDE